MKFQKKAFNWLFVITFLIALTIPVMPLQASATQNLETKRLGGTSRTQTAIEISKEGWSVGAEAVVLARGDNFPDALAGATLAKAYDAPILLTDSNTLSSDTASEISRLNPKTVFILGGTGAISSTIEEQLSTKYTVKRLDGSSRYQTAANIASYLKENGKLKGNTAVIAYAQNFPDALAISSWAAQNGVPILLTETNFIPDATSKTLTDLQISQTIITGGSGVISSNVESQLPQPTRYGGDNRYDTALKIINGLGEATDNIFVATGQNFPDALAGSALAAKYGKAIVLVSPTPQSAVTSVLNKNKGMTTKVYIIGGAGVVSPTTLSNVIQELGGVLGTLKVSFIDVGQGDSILIQTPEGKNILIDGGITEATKTVEDYLMQAGVTKLDDVIATHPDADHIGSLDSVIKDFNIGNVYMPNVTNNTNSYASLLQAIQAKGLNINQAKAGINLPLDQDIEASFLAPVKDSYSETNNYSAVLHLKYGSISFLFTGDAETDSENDMMASSGDLQSTVLKVGHHGSRYSTADTFLNKVNPKYAVISVGENNYGHPASDTLNRLSQHGVTTYRTDEAGTVVAESDGTSVTFNAKPTSSSNQQSSTGDLAIIASVANLTPAQYSTETVKATVTVGGQPVQGAVISITAHYKTTNSTFTGTTGSDGVASIPFSIGRATSGYVVNVDVSVTYNGSTKTTSTSFTPE